MSIWKKYQGVLLPKIPPHKTIQITKEEAKKLLKENSALLIRWSSTFDDENENTFWYVIKDSECSMEELSSNTRSKVRRGLKKLTVKKISKEDLLKLGGYNVYLAANESYNHYVPPMNEGDFNDFILSYDDEDCHFWGVFLKESDKLVAYSQNLIIDDYCDYSIIKFHPKYLRYYLSYALFYEMNSYYLNEKGFRYVNDGPRSMGHDTNIQEFLISKFKFKKAYSKLELYYSLKVKIAIFILYPFRKLFYKSSKNIFKKIGVLLKQHEIYMNQNSTTT